MNVLLTIRMQDIVPGFIEEAGGEYVLRHAARAVLYDKDGRVALLFASMRGYYKLPGGGVEDGEDMRIALARELMEEVGAVAEVYGEIGRIEEWRVTGDDKMHQISDAYVALVSGAIGQPDFTDKEIADGFQVFWADDIDHAVRLVSSTIDHSAHEVRFMSLREKTILEAAKAMEKA